MGSRINRHSTIVALMSYYASTQLLSSISTAAADAAYQMERAEINLNEKFTRLK